MYIYAQIRDIALQTEVDCGIALLLYYVTIYINFLCTDMSPYDDSKIMSVRTPRKEITLALLI